MLGPLRGFLSPLGAALRKLGFSDGFTASRWVRYGSVLTASTTQEGSNVSEPSILYEAPSSSGYVAKLTSLGATGTWLLQDSSAGAADSSGTSHPLTEVGTLTHSQVGPSVSPNNQMPLGISGWATANYLRSSSSAFARTGSFSFGCWLRTGTPSAIMSPASKDNGTGTDRAWSLITSAVTGSRMHFYTFSGGSNLPLTGLTTLLANTWYHCVAVYDQAGPTMTLYLNGVADGSRAGFASINAGTTPLSVGVREITGAFNPWSGQLAGAFYVPSALTATQVRDLYNSSNFLVGAANVWKMWYTGGWGGLTGTNYAESFDGRTWAKWPKNSLLVGYARNFVLKNAGTYYLFGSTSSDGRLDVWTSPDGVTWTTAKIGAISAGGVGQWDSAHIANCWVTVEGGTWHMLYDACAADFRWKLGYATSSDGLTWTKSGSNPVLQSTAGLGAPHVAKVGSTYWLWYLHSSKAADITPTQFKRARSTDFINWTDDPGVVLGQATADEGRDNTNGQLGDPFLLEVDGVVHLFYDASTDGTLESGGFRIKLATFPGTFADLVATREDALSTDWRSTGNASLWSGGELLIPYGTDTLNTPLVALPFSGTSYTMTFDARIRSGATPQLRLVGAYVDDSNFAMFKTSGSGTTYYQERRGGVDQTAIDLSAANGGCDGANHSWKVVRTPTTLALFVDGVQVGATQTVNAVFQVATKVGLGAYLTGTTVTSFVVQ